MAQIQGTRYTTHQATETRGVRDVKADINLLEPNLYPLVAISNAAKGKLKVTGSYKYEWFEDTLLPRFDLLATALTSSATTMVVTNYAYFRAGDLVRVNRNEIVFVSATPSTTSVTIRRAYGSTSGTAAAVGVQLHIIANVSDEGSGVGDVLTTQKVPAYNYTTLHKTPFKVSGTAEASTVYGKSDKNVEVAKNIIEHAKSIEYVWMLGQRKSDTSNETRLTISNGVLAVIDTMVKDAGGTLTEDEMEDFIRMGFRFGSQQRKALFCSGKVISVINAFGREKLQTESSEATYGISVAKYKHAGHQVDLIYHPLLENDSITDFEGLGGTAVMLDIADISYRHLAGRYMSYKEAEPRSDSNMNDYWVCELLTEGGPQIEQEKKHAEMTGVTD